MTALQKQYYVKKTYPQGKGSIWSWFIVATDSSQQAKHSVKFPSMIKTIVIQTEESEMYAMSFTQSTVNHRDN